MFRKFPAEAIKKNPKINATKLKKSITEENPAKTGQIFTDESSYIKKAGDNRKERDKVEELCERAAQSNIQKSAKEHSLLKTTCQGFIDGTQQQIHFADWGRKETAHSLNGKKRMYWLKNEVLNNVQHYLDNAQYVGHAEVDLTHNTNKNTLRLKRKFAKYHYLKFPLAGGQEAYFNIVQHDDGNFYLYTISKQIHVYP